VPPDPTEPPAPALDPPVPDVVPPLPVLDPPVPDVMPPLPVLDPPVPDVVPPLPVLDPPVPDVVPPLPVLDPPVPDVVPPLPVLDPPVPELLPPLPVLEPPVPVIEPPVPVPPLSPGPQAPLSTAATARTRIPNVKARASGPGKTADDRSLGATGVRAMGFSSGKRRGAAQYRGPPSPDLTLRRQI